MGGSAMDIVMKIVAWLAGAYALVIIVLAVSQTALLFPRAAVGPVPALPADTVPLRLDRRAVSRCTVI